MSKYLPARLEARELPELSAATYDGWSLPTLADALTDLAKEWRRIDAHVRQRVGLMMWAARSLTDDEEYEPFRSDVAKQFAVKTETIDRWRLTAETTFALPAASKLGRPRGVSRPVRNSFPKKAKSQEILDADSTRIDKHGQGIIEPETSQQGEDVDDGAGRDHSGSPADSPGAVATTREVAEATSESEPDTREQHPDPDQGTKTAGTPGQSDPAAFALGFARVLLTSAEDAVEILGYTRASAMSKSLRDWLIALDKVLYPPIQREAKCRHERKKQRKGASGMTITECPDCKQSW